MTLLPFQSALHELRSLEKGMSLPRSPTVPTSRTQEHTVCRSCYNWVCSKDKIEFKTSLGKCFTLLFNS